MDIETLKKILPTQELMDAFQEFKLLKTDAEKQAFAEKKTLEFSEKSEVEAHELTAACEKGIENLRLETERLIDILKAKRVSEMLSLSYIARKYFGKTRFWLYQRLNGNIVNGKPAQFNDSEKIILQNALREISDIVGSVKVV